MLPILYSFRRCPYAMRARMALAYAGIQYEHREVILRDKPTALLMISPKGTVPVFVLPDNTVIDESLDIMLWAIAHCKQQPNWLTLTDEQLAITYQLIRQNDKPFKALLDRYKYPNRFSDPRVAEVARKEAESGFLVALEKRLKKTNYLITDVITLADIALFPFIRQFAHTDKHWFDSSDYAQLQKWLSGLLQSDLFSQVMTRYEPWRPEQKPVVIG